MGFPKKMPKWTRINGMRWRIVPRRQVMLGDEALEGVCHFDRRTVEVTIASEDEYEIMSNLYHELLHAMVSEAGVHLDEAAEHAMIATMERWMAQNLMFRERPLRPKSENRQLAAPKTKRARGGRA